jgi:hypothetical protein
MMRLLLLKDVRSAKKVLSFVIYMDHKNIKERSKLSRERLWNTNLGSSSSSSALVNSATKGVLGSPREAPKELCARPEIIVDIC